MLLWAGAEIYRPESLRELNQSALVVPRCHYAFAPAHVAGRPQLPKTRGIASKNGSEQEEDGAAWVAKGGNQLTMLSVRTTCILRKSLHTDSMEMGIAENVLRQHTSCPKAPSQHGSIPLLSQTEQTLGRRYRHDSGRRRRGHCLPPCSDHGHWHTPWHVST